MKHPIRPSSLLFPFSPLLLFLLLLLSLPAGAQTYKTNDIALAINSVTGNTASNSTSIAASGGFAPSMFQLLNPQSPFDVTINFTCNTQVFWGATFVFSGCTDGTTANLFTGSYQGAQAYPGLMQVFCSTNTTSMSNYCATFRSTDTNIWCRPINWGRFVVFHGATNAGPTTLTINKITVSQVQ